MKKKRVLFRKVYFILILTMIFMTVLAGMQAMASTNDQENKVNWRSDTKNEEIQVPEGLTGDGGKWESPTYSSSDDENSTSEETNSKSIETKPMSAEEVYGAIAAGLAGILALSAAKGSSTSSQSAESVPEGNGIWVPESDKDAVIKMINKAASKKYYIDANGFVKEVPGAVEDLTKSSTYSSVLDRLIAGNNKVVIGVDNGCMSYGENGLEENAFSEIDGGITYRR